jgi:hypothetical protein
MKSIEYILNSAVCRKGVETNLVQRNDQPCAANFLRDLLQEIDKLARNCQLTEFTEHGLPHVANLMDRVGTWTRADESSLVKALTNDEACLLAVAICIHDIGMLTQREEDLDESDRVKYASAFADVPGWIRRTHIPRIREIVKRLMAEEYFEFLTTDAFDLVVCLARSHGYWPGEEGYKELETYAQRVGVDPERISGLAAILAVVDLLEEDSGRCDSMTLFANKAGNLMNKAHWLRHMLTEKMYVHKGTVKAQIRIPRNLVGRIDSAVESLRNHLRSAEAYNPLLSALDASIQVCFSDPQINECVPDEPSLKVLFCEPEVHLMRTFPDEVMPPATNGEPAGTIFDWRGVKLRYIDRTVYDKALGPLTTDSGRSDLEITYAAAVHRDEDQRFLVLRLLRDAATKALARGKVDTVRRLTTLVCRDLVDTGRSPLDEELWAVMYHFHWVYRKSDVLLLRRLFERQSNGKSTGETLTYCELKWKIVSLAWELLTHKIEKKQLRWKEITGLINKRLEFINSEFEIEEQIAWHDLIEAMWAVGYFNQPIDEEFLQCYAKLLELERRQRPSFGPLLAELSWRMAVQAHCLRGYGTWSEAPHGHLNRIDYHLESDPGHKTIAKVWITWFHGGYDHRKLLDVARKARKANPPGSEFCTAALEAEWLIANSTIPSRLEDDDSLHRMREFEDAAEKDQGYKIVDDAATSLTNINVVPKKEGTIYFGGRVDFRKVEAFLAERIALRRWYLGSWQRIVGYHVRSSLSLAYTMHMEGDSVVEPVIDAILRLPWGAPYAGKSRDLLKSLFPRVESELRKDDLQHVFELIVDSPKRIGNIRHPGIAVLSDTISLDLLQALVAWTRRELQEPVGHIWPDTFNVWLELMQYADLTCKIWSDLMPLIRYIIHEKRAIGYIKVVKVIVAKAPWAVASHAIMRIFHKSQHANVNAGWLDNVPEAAGWGLLNRSTQAWRGTKEHQVLLDVLKSLTADNNRSTLIEFLSKPRPPEGRSKIAEVWLELLESICHNAVGRENVSSLSFGGLTYPVGPSLPISDKDAYKAADALVKLWRAKNATTEEIARGVELATLLFEAAQRDGRLRLGRSLLHCLESECIAIGFGLDRENCAVIAWKRVAGVSSYFPDELLSDICCLVERRLYDLPGQVAWAQARFAMEVLLRSQNLEEWWNAQSALLVIRARVTLHPVFESKALVGAVGRLMEESDWPPSIAPLIEFIVGWIEVAAFAPDPNIRVSVARFAVKMKERLSSPLSDRIGKIVNKLQQDVRMRVRRVAREIEGSI